MLAEYYSSIEVLPGLYVNGDTVVGEAFADLSAMQAILTLAMKRGDFDLDTILSSFSRDHGMLLEENWVRAYLVDIHAPETYRVNVSA